MTFEAMEKVINFTVITFEPKGYYIWGRGQSY